jgi:hypothetical protein
MSFSRLQNNEAFLRYLHNANLKQKKHLIKSASNEEIEALCECAFNILRKNVPLTEKQLSDLRKPKSRKLVYQLADKQIPIKRKRKIANQTGGFAFLPIIAPILASIIGAIASR